MRAAEHTALDEQAHGGWSSRSSESPGVAI